MVTLKRFDICLVNLDPTQGSEIQKTRPCVIVSPDSMNKSRLKTIIIAPMTSRIHQHYPTRVNIKFNHQSGQVALDQIRVVDRARIVKNMGSIKEKKIKELILHILQVMFS